MDWKHDDLARDLSVHLTCGQSRNRMAWCDVQLGPSGSPRPDVYVMDCSYVRPNPTAYEVKVSRSDFLSDATSGKFQKYYAFASRVVFAVPKGLVKKTEIPDGCGLIERSDRAWRNTRRAIVNPMEVPWSAMMKLLMDGGAQPDPNREWKQKWSMSPERRIMQSKQLSDDVARAVADISAARESARHWKEQSSALYTAHRKAEQKLRQELADLKKSELAKATAELDAERSEILRALGMDGDFDVWRVRGRINDLSRRLNENEEIRNLRSQLTAIEHALQRAKPLGEAA